MEFTAGPEGPLIPDPDERIDAEHRARRESAFEFFRDNLGSIRQLQQKARERGYSGRDRAIMLINVDDLAGSRLANILMPGHDWQRYRDAGDIPMARGLAPTDVVAGFLGEAGYEVAANELAATDDLRVVVLASEVALVLDVQFDEPAS